MKNIYLIIIPLLMFTTACNHCRDKTKNIAVKKEAYLIKITPQDNENKELDSFNVEYAGHLIADEKNNIIFYGPSNELKKELEDLKKSMVKNPPMVIGRAQNISIEEVSTLKAKYPEAKCMNMPTGDYNCWYEKPLISNTEEYVEYVWNKYVRKYAILTSKTQYVYIEEWTGKKLACLNKPKIEKKDYPFLLGARGLRNPFEGNIRIISEKQFN